VLQELLHYTALHYVTNKKEGSIILEGSLGFEIIQEFLEAAFLSLAEPVHFIQENRSAIGCGRMDKGGDAGLHKEGKNCLTKRGSCSCMRGVKFLDPELGGFAGAIHHRGLPNSGWSNKEKGRMGSFL
jgi:hypothetical protein